MKDIYYKKESLFRFIEKYYLHISFTFFLLIIIFSTYKHYGISWDEPGYIMFAKHFIIKIFNIFNIKSNLQDEVLYKYPIDQYNAHIQSKGILIDIMTIFLLQFLKNASFEMIHLIKALYSIPIFILVAYVVNRHIGRIYSFISMILLFLAPRFYGDVFDNAGDIQMALFVVCFSAYFIFYLRSKRTALKTALLCFILALSINQRQILAYLFFVSLIIMFVENNMNKLPVKKFITKALMMILMFILFMHLTNFYLMGKPIIGLIDAFRSSRSFPFNGAVLFEGKNILAPELPWYYLIKSMIITIPLGIIFLTIIGLITCMTTILHRKITNNRRLIAVFFVLLLVVPFLLQIIFRPVLYDGWRHFIFLAIPIIIIASYGIKTIFNYRIKIVSLVLMVFIAINSVLTIVEMIKLHPYQYIYYNELVGGLKGAYGQYETDYWGKAYKEATEWFNKNINDQKKLYTIKLEGNSISSTYYFKPNMKSTENIRDADYVFTFSRWNLQTFYKGKIIKKIERDGVPLI